MEPKAKARQNEQPNLIMLVRVSTDMQDVTRQRADREKLKAKYGCTIERTLELMGVSGTATLDDKQVQQVLGDMSLPEVDGIAVSALDRLFRPAKKFAQWAILDYFKDNHKAIWSVREGHCDPNTREGWEKIMSAGTKAAAQWMDILETCTDGRMQTLKAGKLDHGSAPDGYLYIRRHMPNGNSFVINPDRAPVIRQIFAWRRAGMPVYSIVKELHKAGMRSARGGLWARTVIQQLLRNSTYMGIHSRFGVDVAVPAIIDKETWDEVQAMRARALTQHTGRPSRQYLLRGFLWCGQCGHRCISHGKGVYICGNIEYKPFRRICRAPRMSIERAEGPTFGAIWKLLQDPARLMAMGHAFCAAMAAPDAGADALRAEAEHLHGRVDRTRQMIIEGLMPYLDGKASIRADEQRLRQIGRDLAVMVKVVEMPSWQALQAACADIINGDEPQDYTNRRAVLEGLLDLRITLNLNNLHIEGKVPVAKEVIEDSTDQKKCTRGIGPGSTSPLYVPFQLSVKVA